MTKEEYDRLLQSDYWKGYSYSLIKERNFTCQDCGRCFPGERNKLQVHHLHYRDAKPWSYDPDEVVVLCEECHKRRHGLYVEPEPVRNEQPAEDVQSPDFNYSSTASPDFTRQEGSYSKNYDSRHGATDYTRWQQPAGSGWEKKLLYVAGIALALVFVVRYWPEQSPSEMDESVPQTEIQAESEGLRPAKTHRAAAKAAKQSPAAADEGSENLPQVQGISVPSVDMGSELPVSAVQPEVASPAPQTAAAPKPQREKTTLEILEERNHASVVAQARRAGVSTEGTTTEILERINHASVVKQAKRMGVSTEGTTTEILERINHASVVKQAQRMGVSTEGSTLDILERINRKQLGR